MQRFFVSPDGNMWKVTREGGTVLSRHRTQGAAIDAGRKVARREKGQLIVQRPDGTFRTEWTYGEDPFPPRG